MTEVKVEKKCADCGKVGAHKYYGMRTGGPLTCAGCYSKEGKRRRKAAYKPKTYDMWGGW